MQAYWGRSFGDRASVIYNGIDPADFETAPAYASSQPYILGIGRLVPQKGFDILLRAFAQARLNGRKLIIAGEGGERAALEGLAGELGLSDRVEFFGRADRAAAASLFRGCDFFVLPSRQEPLGIVNLEAMAAGKAVVAAKVGGVPEIVRDGETGLLFPPEDVPGLAGLLTRLASDGTLRRELGERGYARVQDFTMPAAAGRYADIYKSLSSSVPEPAIA
jgi:glycosyltransferase involved in cell wall biosynthesis